MNIRNISESTGGFEVLQTSDRTQTAIMTLRRGESSGNKLEAHRQSDQVLLVLEGEVEGRLADETVTLKKGDVIVIPAGTKHRFINRGAADAITFNTYSPPEY